MTRSDDHDPRLLDQLVDGLPLEAGPEAEALEALLAAEAEAFLPAAERADVDAEAVRLAAFVRDTVLRDEAAAARRVPAGARTPVRGWARILAFSVGLHVVALGILAFALHGERAAEQDPSGAVLGVENPFPSNADDDEDRYSDLLPSMRYHELVKRDLGADLDELARAEQDTVREIFERIEIDEPVAWNGREHPPEVIVPMVRRGHAGIKRRRLDLFGFNAQGTLRAVSRGLDVLALRQDAETGAFHGSDGQASVRNSALATLVFLGEGHTSRGVGARDEVVARSIRSLRARAGSERRVTALGAEHLGPLGVALAEDYMLSYGHLTHQGVLQRSREIERVAAEARARLGADAGMPARERTWLVWALDAAQRAGVSPAGVHDRKLFDTWVASTADPAAGDAADPEAALAVGTALLYAERGEQKPGFTRWTRANAERLLAGLKPTGEARRGDSVAATATILLALQVAYRTY